MKAAIYNGQKDVVVTEIDTPVPGERDVLLRNLCAGICGSDVRVYRNGPADHNILAGHEFGHEVVSEVAAKGAAVAEVEVGERMYPYPRSFMENPGCLGGFSEYILVPNARVGQDIYRVDDAISTKVAAMIEPFTVGTHAVRRSRPQPGENAIVFGAGTIGTSTAIALRRFGCEKVMVVDLSDFRLEKLSAFGFATCNPTTEDLTATAIKTFGPVSYRNGRTADVDIYIEATGADPVIGTVLSMAKKFSRLVAVGIHERPVSVNLTAVSYGQLELIGSGGYMPEDVDFVMDCMRNTDLDLESIVSHQFALDEIATAIEKAGDPQSAMHVSITY